MASVDGANLLNVEGAVGEALAVEHHQALQHLPDGRVRHHRDLGITVPRTSLQKRELCGVKQLPPAGNERQTRMPASAVDQPEQ